MEMIDDETDRTPKPCMPPYSNKHRFCLCEGQNGLEMELVSILIASEGVTYLTLSRPANVASRVAALSFNN